MRRKISLYISDQLVDLDDQSFILFNYTMEDLSNPTIVRNSFSQSITLKGTPNNNRIFGDIFRLDRVTQYGAGYTGVYFDASRKTPFTIYNEMNEIVESGYAKLDQVSRDGMQVEYKVTLFGGLGSFFYNLSTDDDGVKKTLASLRYKIMGGGYTRIPGHFGQVGGYGMVQDAWAYLEHPSDYEAEVEAYDNWWADIINFAPCYNGLPDKFSANKALVEKKSFGNMPTMQTKTDASSNLMVFTNSHTEWEMKDLRWYLQRPVVRIKAIFDAICDKENNGGYDVEISQDFFSQANPLFEEGWVTLPLIPAEDRKRDDAIVRLLATTKTPADYLISFAKIFGLVFLYDGSLKKVKILTRSEFYSMGDAVDLTGRVNSNTIGISPVLAQSRYYQFGGGAIGEWANNYKIDFGVDYGIQMVNTGYEFNSEVKQVTDGIIYKDAVEVQERNLLFVSSFDRDEVVGNGVPLFRLPLYEAVTLQQWSVVDGEDTMTEEDITLPYEGFVFFDNPDYPMSDWLPKVQFHEKDNKSVDGADVLLVFNGMKDTPVWKTWASLEYRLTDDIDDMSLLNEDTACWNFTQYNSKTRTSLPSFRRCQTYDIDGDDVIRVTYEWGEPKARGVNGVFHDSSAPATIYNQWWRAYQSDRYDSDTFKMTCKVNLKGMHVGQELMRRFFFYDGAVFVLNRIVNHSLTTWDDTECEFIKVQDVKNYNS